ncbi:carboxymuconolactone decarboxylase family protein [Maricaulis sp.]|uniref:carboxymuconolactone decarboxylase family protein n=1 Tax=Maricaulis sp. TaxID=1486257 RepID=UPI0025C55677|nr:carboxymuconolactone decarboxylase family protein [Maricaulis sp.]
MTKLMIFDETTAPAKAKPILRSVRSKYGFIPNLMGELAASPAALESYATLSSLYGQSGLTPAEQQVVLLTTSRENNCGYCVAAHSTVSLNTDLDRQVLSALREGTVIDSDPRLEALRQFTASIVRNRGLVERHDIDAFLAAGFTRANILDVMTGVTMKTMSNYVNHIAETELDDAFQAMAWSKPILQHAD